MERQFSRRRVVGGIGTIVAAGVLAGCSTEIADDTDTPDDGSATPTEASGSDGGSTTPTDSSGSDGDSGTLTDSSESDGGAVPSEVSEFLSNTSNFDGSLADETGTDSVSVTVGGDAGLLFAPAAIRVSTGTTITWEWAGGLHNVVAQDGAFDSGGSVSDESTTFEHEFTESGMYLYYCEPHRRQGMKGAVVVE